MRGVWRKLRIAKTVWKKGIRPGLGGALLGGVGDFFGQRTVVWRTEPGIGVGVVRGRHYNRGALCVHVAFFFALFFSFY